ncbi:phytanoyl-CoA dioxygenase [Aquimarina sp. AU119]|nr:phytanoyl-CoA dioxygenase [Aquimarina sp. AU119]
MAEFPYQKSLALIIFSNGRKFMRTFSQLIIHKTLDTIESMKIGDYTEFGFSYHKNFFKEEELSRIEPILIKFHNFWLEENSEIYLKGALNSHSLTSSKNLNKQEKKILFDFISSNRIINLIEFDSPKFLNTQLFFDPNNLNQNNYWHRDIQYTGISETEQKEVIKTQNVVHFRIPLKKELGIELIPKTHRIWDSNEEYEVRNSLNNRKPNDPLKKGKLIELRRSDLLIFSANMIHRGIYGNDRLSFDIIYCNNNPQILKFRDGNNLPIEFELKEFNNAEIF